MGFNLFPPPLYIDMSLKRYVSTVPFTHAYTSNVGAYTCTHISRRHLSTNGGGGVYCFSAAANDCSTGIRVVLASREMKASTQGMTTSSTTTFRGMGWGRGDIGSSEMEEREG